jgi:hypothetical protein
MKRRLRALEAKVAQDGRNLTEPQLAALERVQREKEARGEFESECPGSVARRIPSWRASMPASRARSARAARGLH